MIFSNISILEFVSYLRTNSNQTAISRYFLNVHKELSYFEKTNSQILAFFVMICTNTKQNTPAMKMLSICFYFTGHKSKNVENDHQQKVFDMSRRK